MPAQSQLSGTDAGVLLPAPDELSQVHEAKRRGPAFRADRSAVRRVWINGDDTAVWPALRLGNGTQPDASKRHAQITAAAIAGALKEVIAAILRDPEQDLSQLALARRRIV